MAGWARQAVTRSPRARASHFGIATEGIGLVVCGLAGGIGGGLGGSYLGGELGERFGESASTFGEVVNPIVERAIWGDKPIPPIGYTPRSR